MAKFSVRVKLDNATKSDYKSLEQYMVKEGFTRLFLEVEGLQQKPSIAEYFITSSYTYSTIRKKVHGAANQTGKKFNVYIQEFTDYNP